MMNIIYNYRAGYAGHLYIDAICPLWRFYLHGNSLFSRFSLEYFSYMDKVKANFKLFQPYIVKSLKNGNLFEVRFNDEQYDAFVRDMQLKNCVDFGKAFRVFGTEGYVYSLTLTVARSDWTGCLRKGVYTITEGYYDH